MSLVSVSNQVILRQLIVKSRSTLLINRSIHTTQRLEGKPIGEDAIKNFKDFTWPNEVYTFEHYKNHQDLLDNEFNYPVCRDTMGIKWPGYWFKRKFVYVKEMEPELVVPDLEGFKLKPYVSYRTEEMDTDEFTAKDLFEAVYADKITQQYKENGAENFDVPQESIDNARLAALQTGADLFEEYTIDGVRAPIKWVE